MFWPNEGSVSVTEAYGKGWGHVHGRGPARTWSYIYADMEQTSATSRSFSGTLLFLWFFKNKTASAVTINSHCTGTQITGSAKLLFSVPVTSWPAPRTPMRAGPSLRRQCTRAVCSLLTGPRHIFHAYRKTSFEAISSKNMDPFHGLQYRANPTMYTAPSPEQREAKGCRKRTERRETSEVLTVDRKAGSQDRGAAGCRATEEVLGNITRGTLGCSPQDGQESEPRCGIQGNLQALCSFQSSE